MATRSLSARKSMLFAVLAAAFAAGTMTACKSNQATYRPAPKTTTTTAPAPTYTAPTYTAPAPAPKPAGGTAACGKGGKCG